MTLTEPAALLLYVEDNTFLHDVVETALRDAGFDVEIASSGAEAISVLEAGLGRFRGLVTDIDLGEGPNGWAVARRARELTSALPIVYISGGSSADWGSQAVAKSVMLPKPFAFDQLVVEVSTLLDAAHDLAPIRQTEV
jgi:DNA-binding response OmpR family regulator